MSNVITTSYSLGEDNEVEYVSFSGDSGNCIAKLNDDKITYTYTSRLEGDKQDVVASGQLSLVDCILAAHVHLGLIPPRNFESIPCEVHH